MTGTTTGVGRAELGRGGPVIAGQGLGYMRLEDATSDRVVQRALDLGVTFLDTAELYGDGRNEELVGRALRRRREEVFLCTKGGVRRNASGALETRGDAASLRASCEASLRRLGTDTVDLYYLHRRDPAVPVEESVGALAELVAEGKVRHLGLSDVTAAELRAAHAVHPVAALQSEWSLVAREIEAVVPVCAELGVTVVPYCPHGRGLIGPGLTASDAWVKWNAPRHAGLPSRMAAVARRHGVSPHRVALAWVHRRAEVWGLPVVPIPGTRAVRHLEENTAAAALSLSAGDLALLDPREEPA
ncbi:aldo/keto reductase [Streptomyces hydrogenans]|uniref:aldo/keto reductase n=1 Tax=Streptomyces hydrogenans TaxID=1873719 RepID=UPI0035D70834